jgi:predicted transcriptional regulator
MIHLHSNSQQGELDTHKQSVLRTLRSLMPHRSLTLTEAMERAELQANRLLAMHGIDTPGTPSELVTLLPHLRVEPRYNLPVSGSAHWEASTWVVRVNASDSHARQRFSLMHEFKHVLDHPFPHEIRSASRDRLSHDVMRERVADYFAACVLMPKRLVKAEFCSGIQDVEELARRFDVSPKAMSVRLHQLGLTADHPRCSTGLFSTSHFSSPRTYFRSLATPPLLLTAPGGTS